MTGATPRKWLAWDELRSSWRHPGSSPGRPRRTRSVLAKLAASLLRHALHGTTRELQWTSTGTLRTSGLTRGAALSVDLGPRRSSALQAARTSSSFARTAATPDQCDHLERPSSAPQAKLASFLANFVRVVGSRCRGITVMLGSRKGTKWLTMQTRSRLLSRS